MKKLSAISRQHSARWFLALTTLLLVAQASLLAVDVSAQGYLYGNSGNSTGAFSWLDISGSGISSVLFTNVGGRKILRATFSGGGDGGSNTVLLPGTGIVLIDEGGNTNTIQIDPSIVVTQGAPASVLSGSGAGGCAPVEGKVFHVEMTSCETPDGTIDHPYTNLSDVAAVWGDSDSMLVGAGTFNVSTEIIMTNNQQIIGRGPGVSWVWSSAWHAFGQFGSAFQLSGPSNLVSGFTIISTNDDPTSKNAACVQFRNCEAAVLENCNLFGADFAFYGVNGRGIIRDCTMDSLDGVLSVFSSSSITFRGDELYGGGAIFGDGTNYAFGTHFMHMAVNDSAAMVVVTGCQIDGLTLNAGVLYGAGNVYPPLGSIAFNGGLLVPQEMASFLSATNTANAGDVLHSDGTSNYWGAESAGAGNSGGVTNHWQLNGVDFATNDTMNVSNASTIVSLTFANISGIPTLFVAPSTQIALQSTVSNNFTALSQRAADSNFNSSAYYPRSENPAGYITAVTGFTNGNVVVQDFGIAITAGGANTSKVAVAAGIFGMTKSNNTWLGDNTYSNTTTEAIATFHSNEVHTGASIVFNNGIWVIGTVNAGSLSGNGSLVTSISADNISQGTLASNRLQSTGIGAGSVGSATQIPVLVYDDRGRILTVGTAVPSATGAATNAISMVVSGNSTNANVVTLILGGNLTKSDSAQTSTVSVATSNLVSTAGPMTVSWISGASVNSAGTLAFNGGGSAETITVLATTNNTGAAFVIGGMYNNDDFALVPASGVGVSARVSSGTAGGLGDFYVTSSVKDNGNAVKGAIEVDTRNDNGRTMTIGVSGVVEGEALGNIVFSQIAHVTGLNDSPYYFGYNPNFWGPYIVGNTNKIPSGLTAAQGVTNTQQNSNWIQPGVGPGFGFMNIASNLTQFLFMRSSGICSNLGASGLASNAQAYIQWPTGHVAGVALASGVGVLSNLTGFFSSDETSAVWQTSVTTNNGLSVAIGPTNNPTQYLITPSTLTTNFSLSGSTFYITNGTIQGISTP